MLMFLALSVIVGCFSGAFLLGYEWAMRQRQKTHAGHLIGVDRRISLEMARTEYADQQAESARRIAVAAGERVQDAKDQYRHAFLEEIPSLTSEVAAEREALLNYAYSEISEIHSLKNQCAYLLTARDLWRQVAELERLKAQAAATESASASEIFRLSRWRECLLAGGIGMLCGWLVSVFSW